MQRPFNTSHLAEGCAAITALRYVYAAMTPCFSPYHAGASLSESGVGVTADRLEAIAGCLQPEDSQPQVR
jgi:hypothetical protein